MDNLQALPSGVPVPGNAGTSRWSSCPHLPGPGGLISWRLRTTGAEIQQNRKKKRHRLQEKLLPSACETEGGGCWMEHSGLCRGDLSSLTAGADSAVVVAWLCGFSPELEAVLVVGTVFSSAGIPQAKYQPQAGSSALRAHPPRAFSLLSPWERTRKVSKGDVVLWCFSLFELLEAAEGQTIAPVASLAPLRSQEDREDAERHHLPFSPHPTAPLNHGLAAAPAHTVALQRAPQSRCYQSFTPLPPY